MSIKRSKLMLLIMLALVLIGGIVYASLKTEICFVVDGMTETRSVFIGSTQDFPTVSPAEGYSFEGWVDNNGGLHTEKSVKAGRNDVYTAEFALLLEAKKHTAIIFAQDDGFFHLDEAVSRGELVAMLAPFITADVVSEDNYSDLKPDDAIYQAAGKFKALGLFAGESLEPQRTVSGAELAEILSKFKTPGEISPELPSVELLSREQAVKHLFAVLGIKGAKTVPQDLRGAIPDISPDSEDYALLLEAAVSHSFDTAEDGSCTWTYYEPIRSFEPGFFFIDNRLHYVHEDGSFARNESIGNVPFGADAVFTTGMPELDELVFAVLDEIITEDMDAIEKLEAAYYYVLDNSDYIKRNFYEPGTTYWAEDEAYFMLKTGYGNCYCYAASFYELARALGFDARIYSGYMGQYSDRHGWVEIEIDGENYFFDPQLQMSCWDREEYEILFMVDEAHAHKWNYDYE